MANVKYETATPAEAWKTLRGFGMGISLLIITLSLATIAYRQAFMATSEYCFQVEATQGHVCFSHAYRNTYKEQEFLNAVQAPDKEEDLVI